MKSRKVQVTMWEDCGEEAVVDASVLLARSSWDKCMASLSFQNSHLSGWEVTK